jgi:hypothetical protein
MAFSKVLLAILHSLFRLGIGWMSRHQWPVPRCLRMAQCRAMLPEICRADLNELRTDVSIEKAAVVQGLSRKFQSPD